jgi:hypothetical protein
MNDELPPLPCSYTVDILPSHHRNDIFTAEQMQIYAQAARAPLLARIKELEAERQGKIDENPGHSRWETCSRAELHDALRFQGAMTKDLLPYQERAIKAEARVAELEKLVDHNWTTHQQIIASREAAEKAAAEVERLRSVLQFVQRWNGHKPMPEITARIDAALKEQP